jgi:sporulation protein YlmC with PRC-barrel domain
MTVDIPIDAKVQCSDGLGGRSTLVIINPTTKKVTNVVVREGQDPHTERLVPVRYVVDADDDLIHLSCSRHKLSEMREFVKTEFVRADIPDYEDVADFGPYMLHAYVVPKWIATKHQAIPRGELGIRRGARVRTTDGKVGRVDEFVVEPASGDITHLVMRDGHLWEQEAVTIPVSAIERIEANTVFLKLTKEGVEALPAVPVKRWWR